jgi:chemotaxis protein methyltransferase WspC
MNLAPVIDLLRQRIGLDPASLGTSTLARAVAARMRTLGLTAPPTYASRLAADPQEFQLLLGDLAVPETWFFRGGGVFAYLACQAAEAGRKGGKKFRTLSVPCSTGEEPYSFAIALAEAGVAAAAWEIEAVDLSSALVERARRGRFGEFSFRQTPPELRARYFRSAPGGWELDPVIRSRVRFRAGNLLDTHFLAGEAPFDLIFCRNLFIYFHPDARRRGLDTLAGLLAPDGWVCAGHAEPLESLDHRFRRTGPEEYFLYGRAVATASATLALAERIPPPRPEPPAPPVTPAVPVEASAPIDRLSRARQEADRGQLAEALASCREQLQRSGPSADLYSLMGVIHQARQEKDQAVRCYQAALYLEREHAEALAHLMLLYREHGNHAQAELLRGRLERVSPGGEP